MTEAQAEKRVRYWQDKLAPLGVGHYTIEVFEVVDDDSHGSNAEIWLSKHYDRLQFYIQKNHLESSDPDELDRTILHEWMHVAMRDIDELTGMPVKHLSPQAAELYNEALNHAQENLVDRLATAFLAFHKEN